jgi:glutathione synthase
MTLSVAIQMDAIERINVGSDSTLVLALEASRRGHRLFYYQPKDLSLSNGKVIARVRSLQVRADKNDYYTLGEETLVDLRDMDIVLMRQDPPYDMNYLTTTYLLERIHPHTLVVNNPTEIRNCPEKLLVCNYPELMPPTLITQDKVEITRFRAEHKDIILKPLYAHGGRDVFRVTPEDNNFLTILDALEKLYPCPLIAQAYLPEILQGDKRIILVDGEPKGAITRIPAEGMVRSNLAAGGTAHHTTLTARDHEICAAIGPELKKRGLVFVGIDVIGQYITEINVTSPTGLPSINRLSKLCVEREVWDAIEVKL